MPPRAVTSLWRPIAAAIAPPRHSPLRLKQLDLPLMHQARNQAYNATDRAVDAEDEAALPEIPDVRKQACHSHEEGVLHVVVREEALEKIAQLKDLHVHTRPENTDEQRGPYIEEDIRTEGEKIAPAIVAVFLEELAVLEHDIHALQTQDDVYDPQEQCQHGGDEAHERREDADIARGHCGNGGGSACARPRGGLQAQRL
mmetsp:Transcript_7564/g.15284  ORF Transcript_7564/g.15284 Transcript_7564/m.15284 type:complete len:200 (+) Transcript_7564:112-711(+)